MRVYDGRRGSKMNSKDRFNNLSRLVEYAYLDLEKIPIGKLKQVEAELALIALGLPVDSIGKCQNCLGWFVMMTERRQKYCSKKCSQSFLSRRAYQKKKEVSPEKYEHDLENKRHYMYDRYVKQTESETGAKVKPRPIKRRPKRGSNAQNVLV
jgi:hypothetical protein